jgi:Holliday junction resolvase RusA-like endonuclease
MSNIDTLEKTAACYVEGKFPGMNNIVAASKTHYAVYAKMKKENTELFQVATANFPKFDKPVSITFTWFYRNINRDPDNMMAAQKFVLDGLVKSGCLPNDTGREIAALNHIFIHGEKDGLQIEIEEF